MRRVSTRRGYTLIELLAVIAMIGILAALAIVGYRRWLQWARLAETKDIVAAIATGQDAYYDATRGYLDCSASMTDYYPMAPTSRKHLFHDSSKASSRCWKLLHADTESGTYMSFVTKAGNPGDALPALPTEQQIGVAPPANRPWYVVMAVGDQDEDGVMSYFVTSSLQPGEVHIENETE